MLVAQNSLGPVCPVPLTVRGTEAQAKRNAKRAAKAAEKAQHEPAKLSGDENFLCEAIERIDASESSPHG